MEGREERPEGDKWREGGVEEKRGRDEWEEGGEGCWGGKRNGVERDEK